MYIREIIGHKLRQVVHPKINRDIISLGLVKSIDVKDKILEIKLRNKSKFKNYYQWVQKKVKHELFEYNHDYKINIVCDDVPDQSLKVFPKSNQKQYKIALTCSKSIVGKSYITLNLALSLAKLDLTIGIIDLDIYGHGISLMDKNLLKLNNIDKDAIKFINRNVFWTSLLSYMKDHPFMNWQNTVFKSALNELMQNDKIKEPAILLYELPPVTGYDQLFFFEYLNFKNAIILKAAQNESSMDLEREISNLHSSKKNILGMIEFRNIYKDYNISNSNSMKSEEKDAEILDIPFLGKISLLKLISEYNDVQLSINGENNKTHMSKIFDNIAENIIDNMVLH